MRASIRPDRATPSSALPANVQLAEGTDTTHFSIIDADGNMVAATLTVMVDGRVLASGTPAQIRANAQVQEAYLGAADD